MPDWANYAAWCCNWRHPVYSTLPFTFRDGCGRGPVGCVRLGGLK